MKGEVRMQSAEWAGLQSHGKNGARTFPSACPFVAPGEGDRKGSPPQPTKGSA